MSTIFLPLSWQVWLLHLAMIALGGTAIAVIEATSIDRIQRRRTARGRRIETPGAGVGEEGGEADGADSDTGCGPSALLLSVYAAVIQFLWNGPQHEARTAGGKLALLALSFHTLVIAASYTASLAGFLASSTTLPVEVYSFAQMRSSSPSSVKGRLCVLQAAQVNGAGARSLGTGSGADGAPCPCFG